MMRKVLIFLVFLCCAFIKLSAASYNIQMSVSTQKTNCYADGKIFVKLGGTDLSALSGTDQISFNVQKNGISYKQHDLTIVDMGSDSTFVLDGYPAGVYTFDYSIWIGTNTEIKGSVPAFEVKSKGYLEPVVYQTLGDNKMMQGTRPSLSCRPTGRVQLEIVQGKFPYTVQIFKNGVYFRTDVFNAPMFSGTDPLAEDYKDYYNIELLGIGTYNFIIADSCGYQPPPVEKIEITDVNFTCIPSYATFASSTNTQISFNLKDGFFNNVKYDKYSDQWLEYRFALEGEALGAWKPFSKTDMATVTHIDSVRGKKYLFELRIKDCPAYPVCNAEVLIPAAVIPPPTVCKQQISPSVTIIPIPGSGGSDFCPCDGGTPSPVEYDKWQVLTNFTICEPYTLPLSYRWTNLDYPTFTYSNNNINTAIWSYSSPELPLTDELYGTRVHIELFDANNYVYKDTIILIPPKPAPPQAVAPKPLAWSVGHTVSNTVACNVNPVGSVVLNVNCANIPDGAEVEMTQTPDNLNLKATYDLSARKWVFNTSSTDFIMSQTAYNPNSCLSIMFVNFTQLFRWGTYTFKVKWRTINGTDSTTTLTRTIANNVVRYEVSKQLAYTTKKTCQGTVYYPSAQVQSWQFGDDANKTPVLTKFRVYSGNITGYEINGGTSSAGLCDSDSILITKPGRYIIQAFHSPSGSNLPLASVAACTSCLDTIDYVAQTLSFEDYAGYLCADAKGSTIKGSVTVIAKDGSGVPPYKYDLYSGNDTTGTLLGSNYTGVFSDIKVSSAQFYVRVEDQCLSSFVVAIPLSPIITTDAVFGDRSVCKGSVAYLQGKMLGSTNQVSYLWTGADGFSSTNRQIVSPPILQASTFSLEISGLGCRIFDSITVQPVDKINVEYEDQICKGTNYDGGKEYKLALTTANLDVGTHFFSSNTFTAVNGGCDSTAHLKLRVVEENSVIEDTMAICVDQLPILWQDSLFTASTRSGIYYKSMLGNCPYKHALRLTVGQPVDTLVERIICQGESIVLNNKTLSQSGYYTENLISTTTCDSVVTMHLTVVEPDLTELIDTIYQDESYTKNGFSLLAQKNIGDKYESLLLKNSNGCDSTVYLRLTVLSSAVFIPEVFTPNGDNKNAFFEIKNIELYPRNHLFIFNRWGNKVYEGKPYMNEWDGKNYFGPKVGGDILPVGTYYYLLDLGNGSETIRGYIYLNR